jgi:Asp-tRNA(Asn)/Glu-tRNA(Gln) amidotransferase A subunit family amidase
MRSILTALAIFTCLFSQAQRADSIKQLKGFADYLGFDFTEPERDSMIESLKDFRAIYQQMHALNINNSLQFPFAYEPAPKGVKIPMQSNKMAYPIPANIAMPANKNELAYMSVMQLASLVKNKKISSVELTRFFLDRLKKYNDTLHCVISFTEDIAMKQARQADEEIRKGMYRGPLHGIPYGIKDLFAVKGTKTTFGSTPYKDQVIDEDATVYTKLKNAGAVLCAKLSLGALAYDDIWFGGMTRNPWNMNTGSSGSSAGSASATSAGLLPFAIGTETWGSIISPSHTCGVTGLRPTFGSVSRAGGMVLCWSLDKVGPIGRNAEDAAVIFSVIKGADPADVSSVDRAFNFTPNRDIKKMRIAYAANYFKRLPDDSPEKQALKAFEKMGVKLIETNFPDSIYKADIMSLILTAESAAAFEELTLSGKDDLIERQDKAFWPNTFRAGRFIPAAEYINANRHRYALSEALNNFMKQYDVVIVPSFAGNQSAMTNLTGHPAVCFPVGLRKNGMPTSISLIGNLYDESSILSAAKAFQEATDHEEEHPAYFKSESVNR